MGTAWGIFGLLVLFHLLLPLASLLSLRRQATTSKVQWLLASLLALTFNLYVFLAGAWSWISHYFRWLLPIAFLVVTYQSSRRVREVPWFRSRPVLDWIVSAGKLVVIAFLGFANVVTIQGYFSDQDPVDLAFPLRNGVYVVGQGGSNEILNRHYRSRAQRYALDIGKLTVLGTRAFGIYPKELTRYAIHSDLIHSPCDGRVLQVVDSLADMIPPERDRKHPPGNHLVLACKGINVVLAHLKTGSLAVRIGEVVREGQVLGRVGNSGNSSEPHLHIHAARSGTPNSAMEGEGVPIRFDSRFLARNSLVIRRK